MTNNKNWGEALDGAKRSLSPPGGMPATAPASDAAVAQVIGVVRDLGDENIRLIGEVRALRWWMRPLVIVGFALALAFLFGAYMQQEIAKEQRLTREAYSAEAHRAAAVRQHDSKQLQRALRRAESAANAAQSAANGAAAEGIEAQAEAAEVRAAILPPSKRKPVRAEIKATRARADALRPKGP